MYLFTIYKEEKTNIRFSKGTFRVAHLWGVMCTLIYWGAANSRWGVAVYDFDVMYHYKTGGTTVTLKHR